MKYILGFLIFSVVLLSFKQTEIKFNYLTQSIVDTTKPISKIKFNSFSQLSIDTPKTIGKEIMGKPRLIKKASHWPDSSAYTASWLLNKKYHIVHVQPSRGARLVNDLNDTLQICHQGFDLKKILKDDFEPVVERIRYYTSGNVNYIVIKLLDNSNGTHVGCYLLVFNITDTN